MFAQSSLSHISGCNRCDISVKSMENFITSIISELGTKAPYYVKVSNLGITFPSYSIPNKKRLSSVNRSMMLYNKSTENYDRSQIAKLVYDRSKAITPALLTFAEYVVNCQRLSAKDRRIMIDCINLFPVNKIPEVERLELDSAFKVYKAKFIKFVNGENMSGAVAKTAVWSNYVEPDAKIDRDLKTIQAIKEIGGEITELDRSVLVDVISNNKKRFAISSELDSEVEFADVSKLDGYSLMDLIKSPQLITNWVISGRYKFNVFQTVVKKNKITYLLRDDKIIAKFLTQFNVLKGSCRISEFPDKAPDININDTERFEMNPFNLYQFCKKCIIIGTDEGRVSWKVPRREREESF